jgi:hypothetical protein
MALIPIHNKKYSTANSLAAGLGIGPYDYVFNTYNGTNLIQSDYYRAHGTVNAVYIGSVSMGYDASNLMISAQKVRDDSITITFKDG